MTGSEKREREPGDIDIRDDYDCDYDCDCTNTNIISPGKRARSQSQSPAANNKRQLPSTSTSASTSTSLIPRVIGSLIIVFLVTFVLKFNMRDTTHATHTMMTTNKSTYTPDQSEPSRSTIFLPYCYPFSTHHTPQINATIQGIDFELPIDTGSTGLLIGAPLLPDVDPKAGKPAHAYLTSSRILYVGRLVDLDITFRGERGSYAVTRVPVLVVDKSVVCPWYRPGEDTFTCPYNPNKPEPTPRDTSRITYMGVGFGRNGIKDGQPNAVPRGNPFLNIVEVDGEKVAAGGRFREGYTLSTEGVRLGLTERNTRGFKFTRLEPGLTHDEDPRDWAMVRMEFSLNGKGSYCGPALVDTGIPQMYIRAGEDVEVPSITIPNPNPKGDAKFVKRVKPGTKIAVGIPSLDDGAVAQYSFQVGEGALMEPAYVVPGKQYSPPFVNTGRNFLFGYSIAFDALGGRYGFRPVDPPSLL